MIQPNDQTACDKAASEYANSALNDEMNSGNFYSNYSSFKAGWSECEKHLGQRIKVLETNLEVRTNELHEAVNNADESRWTYWRKRSAEMTEACVYGSKQCAELESKLEVAQTALEKAEHILVSMNGLSASDQPDGYSEALEAANTPEDVLNHYINGMFEINNTKTINELSEALAQLTKESK